MNITKIDELRILTKEFEEKTKIIQNELDESMKKLQQEKEMWEKEKNEISKRFNINDNVINLNVGGRSFTTYKSVLCKKQNSMLAAMFSGRHPIAKDPKGRHFIDCDGKAFSYILNYLRHDEMIWPSDPALVKGIKKNLEYFGLIQDDNWPNIFNDSTCYPLLNTLFPNSEAELLYRASRDGWHSSVFHAKCDGKVHTVSIIKVGGYIFGGYTPCAWDSSSGYKTNTESFLFSLNNPTKQHMGVKFPNNGQGTQSICCNGSYSVTFGGRYDIFISSNANSNNSSYTNLGYSFKHPAFNYDTIAVKTFFCGSYNFSPNEVEVFLLRKE